MKKIVLVLAVTLFLGVLNPIQAVARDRTLDIPKVASVTFPQTVKLADSGCQKIPFRYKAKGVDKEYGLFSVVLKDADGFEIGGAILIRGKYFGDKYPALQQLRKKGKFDVTVCREPWSDPRVDGQISEVSPGNVEVEFSATPKGVPDIDPRVMGILKFTGKFN